MKGLKKEKNTDLVLRKLIPLVIIKLMVLVFFFWGRSEEIMRRVREQQVLELSFMPRLFPVQCYLVEEEDGLTLVDTALPFSVKGIMQAAREFHKPVTRIVLTHAHGDHIGGLDGLKQQLPDVKVYISRRDSRLLAGDRSIEPQEPSVAIRGGVPKPGQIRTRPDVLLDDGDTVGSLRAIAAAGHTPGSMAFLDQRSGVLLAGDAFQLRGGIAVSGHMKPLFPFPAMATWSKETALLSARKLTELRPEVLAVGHGSMLRQPYSAMKRAVEEAAHHFSKHT